MLVALWFEWAQGVVTTGNAGDCRAIIGRVDSAARHGYTAVELTTDHQIDTHPGERERLLASHPNEHDIVHRARVKGRLQPTRGLGDGKYKRVEYMHLVPYVTPLS
jgi:serine/threonine protein phosphatase PrpC